MEVGSVVSLLTAPLASSGPGGIWASDDAVGGVGDDVAGWMTTWWGPRHRSTVGGVYDDIAVGSWRRMVQ